MKHPDDTQEALDFMTRRALLLERNGIERERAIDEAVTSWERSLERSQAMVRFNNHLRAQNKPTLHVPLFEAARVRR